MKVKGIWEAERTGFFEHRIINDDTPSYASQEWLTMYSTSQIHSLQKHCEDDQVAEDARGSFTPLICSAEGVFYKEYRMFQNRLGKTLSMNK